MKNILITLALAASLYSPACAQVDFDSASKAELSGLLSAWGQDFPVPVARAVEEKGAGSCGGYPLTMKLRGRTVTLPAAGVWTLESHLATTGDSFPARRSFPRTVKENISSHLAGSCDMLARLVPGTRCGDVFEGRWEKEWTPPEHGKAGQGSRGEVRPTRAEEMWIFNMMWLGSSMPAAGTKFLATYNGRSVVVVGGYERGPASRKFLGGFQKEVLWYLGAVEGSSRVTLSALSDQSLPPGPVSCR